MKNITLFLGHSHISAFKNAYFRYSHELYDEKEIIEFINLRDLKSIESPKEGGGGYQGVDLDSFYKLIGSAAPNAAVLCLNGNQHNILGFNREDSLSLDSKLEILKRKVKNPLSGWLKLLKTCRPKALIIQLPPPPLNSGAVEKAWALKFPALKFDIESPEIRLKLWEFQCKVTRDVANENGIPVVTFPENIFGSDGFLAPELCGKDTTHANVEYGRRVLPYILKEIEVARKKIKIGFDLNENKRGHPYQSLPDYCFWKQSISRIPSSEVSPVTRIKFKIKPSDRVATAGSCFAQHISKRLRESGYNFFVVEKTQGNQDEAYSRGFYDFSARYGNIYTARQLVQLFDRAFGYYTPAERVWQRHGGRFCDPFRPRIEPEGFDSEEAVVRDRRSHLASVRKMFRNLDIFVFTLGLTESWVSKLDGAAYPVAPGVVGGIFDESKYTFVNFRASEVKEDLENFLRKLKHVNPRAKVILTVSPVPLVATGEDRHVLASTTYSKAVLRVAVEEVAQSYENVFYFPSYEIITGQHVGNGYYEADRRGVTQQGVDHVMRVFMSSLTDQMKPIGGIENKISSNGGSKISEIEAALEAECDEVTLER